MKKRRTLSSLAGRQLSQLATLLIRRLPARLKPGNRLLFLALLTGLSTATMALVLKFLVHRIEVLILAFHISLPLGGLNLNLVSLFSPAVGIGLTILLVRRLANADLSHGVSSVLRAIAVKDARMPRWSSWAYVAACSLTSGFGGSVGMEAPMLATGAGIGSNAGRIARSGYHERVVLMACGAAAAVAAIFKAPIAGLIIALEVLAVDTAVRAVLPIIIASASGAVLSMVFTDQTNSFSFAIHEQFHLENIPWYLILGVFCGLVSVVFTRISYRLETSFKQIPPWRRFLAGSLLVGLLVFIFPPLFGEGYDAMKYLLGGHQSQLMEHSAWNVLTGPDSPLVPLAREVVLLVLMLGMVFLKCLATSITLGSGGVGGIFAPSLLMGCLTGYVFSHGLNLSGLAGLPESNFSLVGMAAVLGGVMHAPLSGIFLIAEITGGYALFLPLMICTVASVFTVKRFETHSLYTHKLAKAGELISQEKDSSALGLLHLKDFIHPDDGQPSTDPGLQAIRALMAASPLAVRTDMSLREVLDAFMRPAGQPVEALGPRSGRTGSPAGSGHPPAGPGPEHPGIGLPSHLPVMSPQGSYTGYLVMAEILAAYRGQILRMTSGEDHPDTPPEDLDRLT